MNVVIHADGICEPNPGKAAWAFLVLGGAERYGFLGDNLTNNHAEYVAVGKAMSYAVKHLRDFQVEVFTDSQLVVNQVSGQWNCNKNNLRLLRDRVRELMDAHGNITLAWIPGVENKADRLTRKAYQEATGVYPQPRIKKVA